MIDSKTLQKPANPETAILSRRTPCFGNGIVIYLKDQFPELNEFLVNLLAELIQIIDPQRPATGPENCLV